jgi:hypothetical protein
MLLPAFFCLGKSINVLEEISPSPTGAYAIITATPSFSSFENRPQKTIAIS